jgi:hypothetical protein
MRGLTIKPPIIAVSKPIIGGKSDALAIPRLKGNANKNMIKPERISGSNALNEGLAAVAGRLVFSIFDILIYRLTVDGRCFLQEVRSVNKLQYMACESTRHFDPGQPPAMRNQPYFTEKIINKIYLTVDTSSKQQCNYRSCLSSQRPNAVNCKNGGIIAVQQAGR